MWDKGHNVFAVARKSLGEIRRKTFKTNNAYWYCKYLSKDDSACRRNEPELRVEFNNYFETVRWIKENYKSFPWIYNQKEMELAETYNHLYPSLKYHKDIIGYVKVAFVQAYIEDYEDIITLENDEAFICDTFVLPEFRGKNMGSFMLCDTLNKLMLNNILFVFCHIPAWNTASSKLYYNMGFKRISHVRYLRVLNYRYFSYKPHIIKEKGRRLFSSNATIH